MISKTHTRHNDFVAESIRLEPGEHKSLKHAINLDAIVAASSSCEAKRYDESKDTLAL